MGWKGKRGREEGKGKKAGEKKKIKFPLTQGDPSTLATADRFKGCR
jgi:hypothetical protein